MFEKAFYNLLSIRLVRPAFDHVVNGNSRMFSYDGTHSTLTRGLLLAMTFTNNTITNTNLNARK
jgi:hypothetical protein